MNKNELKDIIKECIEESIIEEGAKDDRKSMIRCMGTIFGHLVKFVEAPMMLPKRWASTIQNQINNIEGVQSTSKWNSISNSDMPKVIKRAKEVYFDDIKSIHLIVL